MTEVLASPSFQTIDQLAERCGYYCWLEHRLFEVAGRWASSASSGVPSEDDPAVRVFLSELSARHAFLAGQWRDRLPVRAGVDLDAFVGRPPGGAAEALDLLGTAPNLVAVLGGLVEQFLPRLGATYDQHLAGASAVNEGPVHAVLEVAVFRAEQELEHGWALLRREGRPGSTADTAIDLVAQITRVLGHGAGIFPVARAS